MFRYEYSKVFRNSYFAEHLQKLPSEVFLRKAFLKICSEFTRELPCQSVQSKFIKITLRHGCSPVNLMHIFRALFPKNTSEWLLLELRATLFLCFFFALAWTLCSCLCYSSSSSPSVSTSRVLDFRTVNRYPWFWKYLNMTEAISSAFSKVFK